MKAAGTPDLFATLEKFRAALLGREGKAVAAMQDAWEGVGADLRAKLDALTERMEAAQAAGEPLSEGWLYRQARYQDLLAQVEAAGAALAEDGPAIVAGAQSDVLGMAETHTQTLAQAALGPGPAGASVAWNTLPKEAVEAFVGFASDGSPLKELFEELAPEVRDGLRQALANGIAEGVNPREIARRAVPQLDAFRNRAVLIARTETMRSYREASRQTYAANGDVLAGWTWVSALGIRTCASCWAMHGTVHPLDETLDDHPAGRCVAAPLARTFAEILGDPSIPDTRPVIESGASAFGRLPEEEQREILGPAMHDLWASGRVPFERLSVQESDPRWGAMRRAATIEEAQAAAEG